MTNDGMTNGDCLLGPERVTVDRLPCRDIFLSGNLSVRPGVTLPCFDPKETFPANIAANQFRGRAGGAVLPSLFFVLFVVPFFNPRKSRTSHSPVISRPAIAAR